ncbi:MAG: NAD(P)H-dependent oxidoreductase [Pseudomonadota bacterium]
MNILRIDSSTNLESSVTRGLADRVIARLAPAQTVIRDLAREPLPFVTQEWNTARLLPAADRSAAQQEVLALSDTLIAELKAADTVVISVPMYNFTVPAALKAWIDLVARPGETFRYTAEGPEGLLKDKRAIVTMASGGVPAGSPADFATDYLRHFLGFIGITEVDVIAADAIATDSESTLERAHAAIANLAKAA